MKNKIISLVLASAAFGAFAQASDEALLNTLVKKGYLTADEAGQIAKDAVVVAPNGKDTKSLKVGGMLQAQYAYQQNNVRGGGLDAPAQNSFAIRRAFVSLEADLGSGWEALIRADFGEEGSVRDYIDEATVSKKINVSDILVGKLDVGFKKVNFGYEQNTADWNQLTIERSITTAYLAGGEAGFASLAGQGEFGGRFVGLFFNGEVVQVPGLYYGAAVANSQGNEITFQDGNNSLSYWANVGYKTDFAVSSEAISIDGGLNFGYSNKALDIGNDSMWGINPYLCAKWRGLTIIGEFFLEQEGRTEAYPTGFNATAAYRFDLGEMGALEPVVRYSNLSANGTFVPGFKTTADFNNAASYYIGANWYVNNDNSLKVQLGYEYTEFNKPTHQECSNTVRAQMQVLF